MEILDRTQKQDTLLNVQRLILISGYGGSGKTTCADALEHHLDHAARVEADEMFRIKPFDLSGDKLGRIKMRNCTAVISTFLDEDYGSIICSGLVWAQQELDTIAAAFSNRCAIILFWLKTSKEIRYKRVLARSRDAADSKEFLDRIEEKIIDPLPFTCPANTEVYEIPTDNQEACDVVKEMMRYLSSQ